MRLIDIENIDYVRLEDSLHCLEHHKGDEVECVICAPLVEAIPKADYENRLKADKNNSGNDCISRAQAIERLKLNFPISDGADNSRDRHRYMQALADLQAIRELPSVTPQPRKGHCKDCKWWKDSDGKYRRGCGAESQCPINTHAVYCGEGYCYMFEPQDSEVDEGI